MPGKNKITKISKILQYSWICYAFTSSTTTTRCSGKLELRVASSMTSLVIKMKYVRLITSRICVQSVFVHMEWVSAAASSHACIYIRKSKAKHRTALISMMRHAADATNLAKCSLLFRVIQNKCKPSLINSEKWYLCSQFVHFEMIAQQMNNPVQTPFCYGKRNESESSENNKNERERELNMCILGIILFDRTTKSL